jgi:hypothetical protein
VIADLRNFFGDRWRLLPLLGAPLTIVATWFSVGFKSIVPLVIAGAFVLYAHIRLIAVRTTPWEVAYGLLDVAWLTVVVVGCTLLFAHY